MKAKPSFGHQLGQSMTEYTVVLVFGVLALTTGPTGDVMQDLLDVMKENYEGYSFAMSMSEPPDFDNEIDYETYLIAQGLEPEEIDRLAVNSTDLLDDIQVYNQDPLGQINQGINTIRNCANAVGQLNLGNLLSGQVGCP